MSRRSISRGRALAVEHLERRLAMAGVVSVALQGGNLTITGDAYDNSIVVDQLAYNQYRITGQVDDAGNPTAIKFGVSVTQKLTVTAVPKKVSVDLKNGNDEFSAIGLGATTPFAVDDFMLKMGTGNDTAFLEISTGDDMQIDMGTGNYDLVLYRSVVGNGVVSGLQHDLTVKIGQGSGVFCLQESQVNGDATILLNGLAADQSLVDIKKSQIAEKLAVTGTAGADEVWCHDVSARGGASFKLGSGNDSLEISRFGGMASLVVDTGQGDDKVEMDSLQYIGVLTVRLAAGTDKLTLGASAWSTRSVVSVASLDGGPNTLGPDVLELYAADVQIGTLKLKNFEA